MSAIVFLEAVVLKACAAVWLCSYNTNLFVSVRILWMAENQQSWMSQPQQAELTWPGNCCEGYMLGVSCMLAVSINSLRNKSSSSLIINPAAATCMKFYLNWILQTQEGIPFIWVTRFYMKTGCFLSVLKHNHMTEEVCVSGDLICVYNFRVEEVSALFLLH